MKNIDFSSRTFRNEFKAAAIADLSKWVIKKYIAKVLKNMEDLGMALEHACNRVQLPRPHNLSLVKLFNTGKFILHSRIVPVTVVELIDLQFDKYIRNDGRCKMSPSVDMKCDNQKTYSLLQYSYELSIRENLCFLKCWEQYKLCATQELLLLDLLG